MTTRLLKIRASQSGISGMSDAPTIRKSVRGWSIAMKVSDLMKSPVRTCTQNDTLNVAARIMWEGDCGSIPVVDAADKLVGIITDRDICMAAYTQGESLHRMRVESAMASPVAQCVPDDDLQIAEQFMHDRKLRRLPVCDAEGRVVGILSLSDIATEVQRERASGTQAVPASDPARILAAVCEPRHTAAQFGFAPEPGELDQLPKTPKKPGAGHRV